MSDGTVVPAQKKKVIVFLDETGDHSLNKIDLNFPIFLLALVICDPAEYVSQIVSEFYRLKYDYFGHEAVVLHSYEIRKRYGSFDILNDPAIRVPFLQRITNVITSATYGLILCGINKDAHKKKYKDNALSPYDLALEFALERLVRTLGYRYPVGTEITILAEARGKREDEDLQLTFLKFITQGTTYAKRESFTVYPMRMMFVTKETNVVGLQMADLIAYPAARYVLSPSTPNPAYESFKAKIWSEKTFP